MFYYIWRKSRNCLPPEPIPHNSQILTAYHPTFTNLSLRNYYCRRTENIPFDCPYSAKPPTSYWTVKLQKPQTDPWHQSTQYPVISNSEVHFKTQIYYFDSGCTSHLNPCLLMIWRIKLCNIRVFKYNFKTSKKRIVISVLQQDLRLTQQKVGTSKIASLADSRHSNKLRVNTQ